MAFSLQVNCKSNNEVEALAAKFGANWCLHNGYMDFSLEMDCLIIKDMLIRNHTNNHRLKYLIEDITNPSSKLLLLQLIVRGKQTK
ncbi:hypothetical protein RND71_003315 [Anisodus tanguticus]|uniref:RNase H type-1 domain-containing protein n=1 Tax=Anisodus tanguticus TaxID=243964 RepID=A0AAE1VWK8_9SOLA|nr:hypothetical protein RND71_003315 [Anisodus tanguticus]